MKFKKAIALLMTSTMMLAGLAGCGKKEEKTTTTTEATTVATEATVTEATVPDATIGEAVSMTKATPSEASATDAVVVGTGEVRVGSLKGPTTMGLVNLMDATDKGEAKGSYTFDMETQADVIAAKMVKGELDIALVPANLAAVLYNKTEGKVAVTNINTLNVLYCVTGDTSIKSVQDLAGKTVVTTGQGATPEYSLRYLLEKNGITDCTLEFKSEATEVAAVLKNDPTAIAVLPQPFVTVAEMQNDALVTAFSLQDEWAKVDSASQIVTGVTIVRKEFLEKNPEAVQLFLDEESVSATKATEDVDTTAELVVKYGILPKAPIAKKALAQCNIVYVSGTEMYASLSGYLQVLYDANPKAVGGALPADDFYHFYE